MQILQKISLLILVAKFLQHVVALVVLGVGVEERRPSGGIENERIVARSGYLFDCVEDVVLNGLNQLLAFFE